MASAESASHPSPTARRRGFCGDGTMGAVAAMPTSVAAARAARHRDNPEPARENARMTPVARLSLATGSVLMIATGYVDAYTFLQHGHVFAQAMTGNLVLIAIGAFEPSVVAFWRPLVAYGAFMAGVAVLWAWSRRRDTPGPQLATLGLLVAVLVVVGFVPAGTLSVAVTAVIALAAGMQIAAFRDVGRAAFTTTVMTTNSM